MTTIHEGNFYYHKVLKIRVYVISISHGYAECEDEDGNHISTHISKLEDLSEEDE